MPAYREIPPAPRLAAAIECYWLGRAGGDGPHRVTPDGCADILFTGDALQVVGPMTVWRDYPLRNGQHMFGVRFRPGMWSAILGVPAHSLTDQTVPVDALWGARAFRLAERLAEAQSVERAIGTFEAVVQAPAALGPVERALAWMEQRRGAVSMDELADRAGLSPRQLRRVCLERTGLTPKLLARVLRFRHAWQRVTEGPPSALGGARRGAPWGAPWTLADLALECGYYDQAHFIHEFRAFSGRTPAAPPADGRFFQSPPSGSGVTSHS